MTLKNWLKREGIEQKQMAEDLGVSASTVFMWCNGKAIPKPGAMRDLSVYVGADICIVIRDGRLWVDISDYDTKADILDNIIDDIQTLRNCSCSTSDGIIDDVENIIDKYKQEG